MSNSELLQVKNEPKMPYKIEKHQVVEKDLHIRPKDRFVRKKKKVCQNANLLLRINKSLLSQSNC